MDRSGQRVAERVRDLHHFLPPSCIIAQLSTSYHMAQLPNNVVKWLQFGNEFEFWVYRHVEYNV
jgi:hypothetical protein